MGTHCAARNQCQSPSTSTAIKAWPSWQIRQSLHFNAAIRSFDDQPPTHRSFSGSMRVLRGMKRFGGESRQTCLLSVLIVQTRRAGRLIVLTKLPTHEINSVPFNVNLPGNDELLQKVIATRPWAIQFPNDPRRMPTAKRTHDGLSRIHFTLAASMNALIFSFIRSITFAKPVNSRVGFAPASNSRCTHSLSPT